ncbi:insulinase family protein [Vibrio agarivorans]|uniref:insulinase family protein n=1 Tax=Vibrio agarivorans TaxID=153622 RepID=UPI00223165CF|nr:insulinase family protein [Vibrio agarivorans]
MHISPNDKCQYRALTLDNALRVLLVQDDQAQKSAAALAVNVGHFDDPQDREGLAHYLEHMLFLGTEKFPNVGEFQRFISQHGGSNNAWTGTEHTCFFFDISNDTFEQGLDRFSQFFIAPLFNPDAADKERHAVDSEYKMKLNDDSRRLYQVHKELVSAQHPFSQFSVGNIETLEDRENESIRDVVMQFHQQQYSADIMTLVLISPDSLDTLEQHATKYFASIENNSKQGKKVSVALVDEKSVGLRVHVEPLKEMRKLSIAFILPAMDDYYQTKPLSYIAHLIGYEGPDSLMLKLKEAGWILGLSAGGGVSGSNYREFTVSCSLTEVGLQHIDDIVQAIMQAIRQIESHGLQEWRYWEKQAVLEAAFRFQEPTRTMDKASHLVVNMQHYEPDDYIYGDYMMAAYDEVAIKQCLGFFTTQNARITVVAQGLEYDREAKWYFTPYSCRSITPQEHAYYSEQKPTFDSALPEKNPFICYDLEPKAIEGQQDNPMIIEEAEGFTLWHLQDTEYRVPKGMTYIAIDSPHAVASPSNIVKTRLCVEMLLDALAQDTYQAEIAGMGYNLYTHQGGVTLTVSGFSQKQPELLKMILKKFTERSFNPERFTSIKTLLARAWNNSAKDRPISQLFNAMTGLLQPNNPPASVLAQALESIELDELPPFVEQLLATLHVEMFVYGDWTQSEAFELGETIKNALRVKNQTYEESLRPLIMLGNQGTYQREHQCGQDDSAVVVYYQCDNSDTRSIALYSLANHLMSAAFFNEIRTKQQLGYMVGTGNMPLNRHPGIVAYVQSPKVGPNELIQSIDEFLNAFYMVLLELDDYQWHSSKRGLWNQIATPDQTMRNRAQRLWVAIGNKDHEFNQKEVVLDELKSLTRADMIRFVVNELKPRTSNRLVMHTKGNAHNDCEPLSLGQEIGSIKEFQLKPKDCELG